MKNQIGYFLFFLLTCLTCYAIRVGPSGFSRAEIRAATSLEDLATPLIESGKLTGVSVGVVTMDDQGEWITQSYHFGQVQTKSGAGQQPHTPTDETLYEIGGISTVMTGILLAAAIEQDEVQLGTTVGSLLPKGTRFPQPENSEITLLDLALHRSGLPRLAGNMPMAQLDDPYADYTSKLGTEFLLQANLSGTPGSRYEYSNFGMSYLGHLLTRAAGAESYDELLTARVTLPLGMSQTASELADEDSQLVIGHDTRGKPTSPWHFADMPGSGGIRSSIADMNRFMLAHLQSSDDELDRVLNLAFEKQVDPLGYEFAMGLGWMIARDGRTRFSFGRTGGYAASMFVSRDHNVGVCVLGNGAVEELNTAAELMTQWQLGLVVNVPNVERQISPSQAMKEFGDLLRKALQ